MLIIIDHRIPDLVKTNLSKYGNVVELDGSGICYAPIDSHPDVYMCNCNGRFIVAPNVPRNIIEAFEMNEIVFEFGTTVVSGGHPSTSAYNAVFNGDYLIHNEQNTDPVIRKSFSGQSIHVSQSYTRCSLLPLSDQIYLTSDPGICKALESRDFDVNLLSSKDVLLPGLDYGLFGGVGSVYNGSLFLIGSLDYFSDREIVRKKLEQNNLDLIELYDGPLIDGGSIIFLEK
jgi:hypothetical protein